MIYIVSFICNGVPCANLVNAPNMKTAKEYFIEKQLDEKTELFVGIREYFGGYKPGIPMHIVAKGWTSKNKKNM